YAYPSNGTVMDSGRDANTAQVVVRLPDPNGEVWFNGQKTGQTGTARSFTIPPLEPGHTYTYDISAAWHQDGRLVTQTRKVEVSPGSAVAVDFSTVPPLTPIGQQ